MASEGSTSDWLRWLKGTDPKRVHDAKIFLGGIGPNDSVELEPLVEVLSSSDGDLLFWALVALKRLGSRAEVALPRIQALCSEGSSPAIRQSAAKALIGVAPSERRTAEILRSLLGDRSGFVRREALQAMNSLTTLNSEDTAAIEAMVSDSDPAVVRWAQVVLDKLRRGNREATD